MGVDNCEGFWSLESESKEPRSCRSTCNAGGKLGSKADDLGSLTVSSIGGRVAGEVNLDLCGLKPTFMARMKLEPDAHEKGRFAFVRSRTSVYTSSSVDAP